MLRALTILLLLVACEAQPPARQRPSETTFPSVERPVADIVSSQFSDEESRERVGEAAEVMDFMGITAGETVADIGAGRGYYTLKLSGRVGEGGRVFGEDIFKETADALDKRLKNAGSEECHGRARRLPADSEASPASLDHALLVHMYHEIENPYELLWNLRSSLKPGATVGIIDADRPTRNHGTPPWLLDCEVGAIGFTRKNFYLLGDGKSYLSIYAATKPRPRPLDIQPCRSSP